MENAAQAQAGGENGAAFAGGPPTKRTFKVVLLGEVNVGKTSLFQQLRLGKFQHWGTSIGVDQFSRDFDIDGATVTLQVWDTAGSEKYRTLTANYYHSAAACVYVFDLGAVDSLYNLSTWADDARRFEPRHAMFLVGNKCDLNEDDICLEESTIETFNTELQFKSSWKVSAQAGTNVQDFFEHVARTLMERAGGGTPRANSSTITVIQEPVLKKPCAC